MVEFLIEPDADGVVWSFPEMLENGKYVVYATDPERRAQASYTLHEPKDCFVGSPVVVVVTPELVRCCNVNNDIRRQYCKRALLLWLSQHGKEVQ